jgi:alcohol dehydrogenase
MAYDRRQVWRTKAAGALSDLVLTEEAMPAKPAGHRRLQVAAVGLNFADIFALVGLYSATPQGSFVPGLECAGVDEETGERLIALTRFGGYASRLDVDPAHCLPLPSDWSFAEGAAYAAQALTALYALRNLGAVAPGQVVLVHSAAGGVGLNALALCQKLGAHPIGSVGSPDKVRFLRERGFADVFVRDRSIREPVLQLLRGRDLSLVLDAVGGRVFTESYALLAPTGRLVTFGAAEFTPRGRRVNYLFAALKYLRRPRLDPLAMIAGNKSVLGFNLIWLWDRLAMLTPLKDELMALGPVRPHVGRSFAFAEAHAALDHLKSGASVGKVVLAL